MAADVQIPCVAKSYKTLMLAAGEIDGLVQERRNSIANALELCLSCNNPSKWFLVIHNKTTCAILVLRIDLKCKLILSLLK